MEFNAWQSILEEIIGRPENELLEKAVANGKIPIGYTCSYVPRVILSVDGLVPVRIRAPGIAGTEIADIYLSKVTCSYPRSLLEYAMDGRYEFLGGWVFAASCDHLRRFLDNLDYLLKPEFTHILDVPHRRGEAALKWYVGELNILCGKLADNFGVDTGKDALSAAISRQNRFHRKLRRIADLRKMKNPPLSGTEFQRIMIASLVACRDRMEDDLERVRELLNGRRGIEDYRARLMVVGGNLDDTEFINIIESTGGLVVADRFCTGSIPGINLINEDEDPLAAIAGHTLSQTDCPRMMEDFARRFDSILRLKDEYGVDGVVVENLKFCDIWGIESGLLMTSLREAGVPALRLERDYRLTGVGQLRTRIQAFLESMGK